jgi:hypothetical protein
MMTIKVEEQEYNFPTSWAELKWKNYVGLLDLEAKRDSYLVPLMYTQRYIEILCGQPEGAFDEMDLDVQSELEPVITTAFDPALLTSINTMKDHFVINGVTYSFYSANSIGNIKFGEQGYIETLKMNSKDTNSYLLKALAVLIRPATSVINSEGLTKWKLDKFNAEDLDHRAKILEENLSLIDLIMVHNFFLSGASI